MPLPAADVDADWRDRDRARHPDDRRPLRRLADAAVESAHADLPRRREGVRRGQALARRCACDRSARPKADRARGRRLRPAAQLLPVPAAVTDTLERSPPAVACALRLLGRSPDEAIAIVRAHRPGGPRPWQEAYGARAQPAADGSRQSSHAPRSRTSWLATANPLSRSTLRNAASSRSSAKGSTRPHSLQTRWWWWSSATSTRS